MFFSFGRFTRSYISSTFLFALLMVPVALHAIGDSVAQETYRRLSQPLTRISSSASRTALSHNTVPRLQKIDATQKNIAPKIAAPKDDSALGALSREALDHATLIKSEQSTQTVPQKAPSLGLWSWVKTLGSTAWNAICGIDPLTFDVRSTPDLIGSVVARTVVDAPGVGLESMMNDVVSHVHDPLTQAITQQLAPVFVGQVEGTLEWGASATAERLIVKPFIEQPLAAFVQSYDKDLTLKDFERPAKGAALAYAGSLVKFVCSSGLRTLLKSAFNLSDSSPALYLLDHAHEAFLMTRLVRTGWRIVQRAHGFDIDKITEDLMAGKTTLRELVRLCKESAGLAHDISAYLESKAGSADNQQTHEKLALLAKWASWGSKKLHDWITSTEQNQYVQGLLNINIPYVTAAYATKH